MVTAENLEAFFQAYVACAIWVESDEVGDCADASQLDAATRDSMREQCSQFIAAGIALNALPSEYAPRVMEQAGRDLWLTRNGHGTGFWDREDEEYGEGNKEKLDALCGWGKQFQDVNLELVGETIHQFPLFNKPTQGERYEQWLTKGK